MCVCGQRYRRTFPASCAPPAMRATCLGGGAEDGASWQRVCLEGSRGRRRLPLPRPKGQKKKRGARCCSHPLPPPPPFQSRTPPAGVPPEASTYVYFRDAILPASDAEDEGGAAFSDSDGEGGGRHGGGGGFGSGSEASEGVALAAASSARSSARGGVGAAPAARRPSTRPRPRPPRPPPRVDRQQLIIILVGLPGRGKTFLCNKLMCYLNWLGHETRHFNVGQYRRAQAAGGGAAGGAAAAAAAAALAPTSSAAAADARAAQDAAFFDHRNPAGREARERALAAALEDMEGWLSSSGGQVAIFDATNSTASRRGALRARFHGRWQYLFIESICNDPAVLELNYRFKMLYSPDYAAAPDTAAALADFRARIAK